MELFRRTEITGGVGSLQPAVRLGLALVEVEAGGEDWDPAQGRIWILREGEQISDDCGGEVKRSENLLKRRGGSGSGAKENESSATAAARSRDLEEIGEPARDKGWIGIWREGDRISGDCSGEIREPSRDERRISDVTYERAPEIGV
ncbi:hypothetical protein TIFTF001_046916 [Ficus carica]|uniref:Uncharacterized protein n=1 Tax=Ficus carica TaxID=3494 RepID=A0AA88CIX5_FICCA|nr:hypothetical protein TIFTF001_046916 [Ficus carica]